jgi:hypothetical protein
MCPEIGRLVLARTGLPWPNARNSSPEEECRSAGLSGASRRRIAVAAPARVASEAEAVTGERRPPLARPRRRRRTRTVPHGELVRHLDHSAQDRRDAHPPGVLAGYDL